MSICRTSIAGLRRGLTAALAMLGCLVVCTSPRVALGQNAPSYTGHWQADPMTVRWVIGEWGDVCGPRPSGGGDPGGEVSIDVKADELVITAADKSSYSTEQCWAMHPELDRQSHAKGQRSWATTCRTRPNDARQEILQTTVTASGDVITFRESGQYQFVLQGQTCSASSGRWRTYRRIAEGEPAPPPELPAHEFPEDAPRRPPAPTNACATPGAPARIEVRPARKLMRGGESFTFHASVFDARGCTLRTPVSWVLEPPGAAAKLDGGELAVDAGATDIQLSVIATAASQSVTVAVDVVSNDRYVALLESGNFTADGASIEAATATITAGSFGAQDAAQQEPTERKWTFVALVGSIAVLFGLLGGYLLRRAYRRRPKVRDFQTVLEQPDLPIPRMGGTATRLEAPAPLAAPRAATVCPVCGTLYPTRDMKSCPKDGAQLIPVNA